MDARRFPTEPGWRVGKSPQHQRGFVCSVEERPFLLVTFLWANKEKLPAALVAEAFDLALVFSVKTNSKSFRLAAGYFLCLAKESNQRKALSSTLQTNGFVGAGDFPTRHS